MNHRGHRILWITLTILWVTSAAHNLWRYLTDNEPRNVGLLLITWAVVSLIGATQTIAVMHAETRHAQPPRAPGRHARPKGPTR